MAGAKRLLSLGFILVCTVAVLIGCRKTVPVENINTPMPVTASAASKAQIADAIIQGGMVTGWTFAPAGDGEMTGTLRIRTHTAIVTIHYDNASYRIEYKDSVNLKHKDGKIHPYYNGWIHNLDKNIRARLSNLGK